MKKNIWEVQYLSLPPVIKYCKKCGRKMVFTCSKQFRINAQQKYLDIWLIYKCSDCGTTWNATVFSRISPQAINKELLDRFYRNDKDMAEQYAMDHVFLSGNGVEAGPPQYSVMGDRFSPNEKILLTIKSNYFCPIKVSSIVRNKLDLSQKEYASLISDGRIRSIPAQDLQKCRLKDGIVLLFE